MIFTALKAVPVTKKARVQNEHTPCMHYKKCNVREPKSDCRTYNVAAGITTQTNFCIIYCGVLTFCTESEKKSTRELALRTPKLPYINFFRKQNVIHIIRINRFSLDNFIDREKNNMHTMKYI